MTPNDDGTWELTRVIPATRVHFVFDVDGVHRIAEDEMFGNEYEKYIGDDNLADFIPASTGSYAACEALNYARGVIGMIGNVDMSSCLVGKTIGEDLVDDDFHIYEFTMDEMVMKVKIRRVANDEGFLKGVEMMSCSEGKQTEYTKWDFSG